MSFKIRKNGLSKVIPSSTTKNGPSLCFREGGVNNYIDLVREGETQDVLGPLKVKDPSSFVEKTTTEKLLPTVTDERVSQDLVPIEMNSFCMVIGEREETSAATFYGRVRILNKTGEETYEADVTLGPAELTHNSAFGHYISLSETHLAVTANNYPAGVGTVFVWEYQGNGDWGTPYKLINPSSNATNQHFGMSVKIVGDYLYTSSIYEDANQGKAYVYKNQGNNTWTYLTSLTHTGSTHYFGSGLDASDNYVVVGSHVNANKRGDITIFRKVGDSFVEKVTYQGATPEDYSFFGTHKMSIVGDTILVNQPNVNATDGRLHIFNRVGTNTWSDVQQLDGLYQHGYFSHSSYLSEDENNIVAVSLEHTVGAVGLITLFERTSATTFGNRKEILPNGGFISGSFCRGLAGYGNSFAVAGQYIENSMLYSWYKSEFAPLLVPAVTMVEKFPEETSLNFQPTWTNQPNALIEIDSNSFCIASGMANGNTTMLTGEVHITPKISEFEYGPSYRLEEHIGSTLTDNFGCSVSMNETYLAVGSYQMIDLAEVIGSCGAVFVYTWNGTDWGTSYRIPEPPTGFGTIQFGYDIALTDDNMLYVGAKNYNSSMGRIYVYEKGAGDTWEYRTYLDNPTGTADTYIGARVAADGNYVATYTGSGGGAINSRVIIWEKLTSSSFSAPATYFPTGAGTSAAWKRLIMKGDCLAISNYDMGRVWIYNRTSGNNWTEERYLDSQDPVAGHKFGFGMDFNDNYFAIASQNTSEGSGGRIDIYDRTNYSINNHYYS